MTDANDATSEDAPDSFSAFLCTTNKGRTERELSEAMQRVVSAVQETGKPGSLVLRVDVKPVKGTDGEQVVVTDSVTTKTPKLDRPVSMFFVTNNAGLSRQDPNQRSIFEIAEENTNR